MRNQDIDWSKAPADATHWHDEYDCYVACWVKEQEGQRYYLRADGEGKTWMKDRNPLPIDKCIPRPAAQPAWSGEGLPPVGTVCEWAHAGQWLKVEVAYLSDWLIVLRDTRKAEPGLVASEGVEIAIDHWKEDAPVFRPIRTPEQITAEEREKAIEEMARIGNMADTPKSMAAKLYDAGCRMVTP